jgi:2-dehydropantoate 2-reductase
MKVCVFGAGAIGGHLALRLAQAGEEVAVVARGEILEAIRARGLTVEAADGTFTVPLRAEQDPARLGPQDLVLVTVKAPALAGVAAGIAPLLGPATEVAFVMNGIPWWFFQGIGGPDEGLGIEALDPGGALARRLDPSRVVGGVIYSACTVVSPGRIHVENRRSRLVLGKPDGSLPPWLTAFAARLTSPGLLTETTPRIRDWVWSKWLLNLTSGPFSLLTGRAPREMYREPALAEAARTLIAEGQALAAAYGAHIEADAEAQVRQYLNMSHKPSILQDFEQGKPLERAALFEVPLWLAERKGVKTPLLALLTALVRLRTGGG